MRWRTGAWLGRLLAALFICVAVGTGGGVAQAESGTCSGQAWDPNNPCFTLTPSFGPVGTRVVVTGELTVNNSQWRSLLRSNQAGLTALAVPGAGCLLEGGGIADFQAHVNAEGMVRGHFTVVGGRQGCHQSSGRDAFRPGVYAVEVGCSVCQVAVFRIAPSATRLAFSGPRPPVVPATLAGLALIAVGVALLLGARLRRRRLWVPVHAVRSMIGA
jgi:hypothetical protein